jgi:hypothetical protein
MATAEGIHQSAAVGRVFLQVMTAGYSMAGVNLP